MDEIKEIEVMMPVTVLYEGCANCERLDIYVRNEKLFADGEIVGTYNYLRCTNVYECKKYAELVRKIMDGGKA